MSDQLTFTLQTDQGTLVSTFGQFMPIPVSGTLQNMVNLIANTESTVQSAIDAANTATSQAGVATTQANNAAGSATQASASASTATTQLTAQTRPQQVRQQRPIKRLPQRQKRALQPHRPLMRQQVQQQL
jgi:hypothetical protein